MTFCDILSPSALFHELLNILFSLNTLDFFLLNRFVTLVTVPSVTPYAVTPYAVTPYAVTPYPKVKVNA